MSPKSAQPFWANDMHENRDLKRVAGSRLRRVVVARHDALDVLDAHPLRLARAVDVAEDLVDAVEGDLRFEGLTEQKLVEGAFELASAAGHRTGDVIENLVRDVERGAVDL